MNEDPRSDGRSIYGMKRYRNLALAGAATMVLLLSTAHALANPGAEGEPWFGISAHFLRAPRLYGETPILVRVWGENRYGRSVTSSVHITVPEGIEVISGQTLSVTSPTGGLRAKPERKWQVVLVPRRQGSYEIRGTLKIDAGPERGVDETDFVLSLEVGPDTVIYSRAPRATRFERVWEGQRYRYAGQYLVPIDSSEAVLQDEIDRRPEVVRQTAATCSACSGDLPVLVPLAVIVGKDGLPREARYLDISEEGTIDPAIVAAAKEALPQWQFAPASSKGRPVVDFLVIRVPVKAPTP